MRRTPQNLTCPYWPIISGKSFNYILESRNWILSVINLSSIPCPQSNLYTDRYNLLLKIRRGPSGGPWTRVVCKVVHGPGSMFCICLFPCTCIR